MRRARALSGLLAGGLANVVRYSGGSRCATSRSRLSRSASLACAFARAIDTNPPSRGWPVARYRLRFLLQEFDLPRGITIIGRSLDCHLTIEDPLVSRQHARIVIDDAGAYVEDMGSRNGVRVDGATIRGPTQLIDGMRIRIGTQDFLFCNVEIPGKAATKTTGVLRLCASCRMPYPREAPSFPNRGATEQTAEDTLPGVRPAQGAHSARAWSAQRLVEALDRALTLGRLQDAERILRRATAQIEEMVSAGASFDGASIAALPSPTAARTPPPTHAP